MHRFLPVLLSAALLAAPAAADPKPDDAVMAVLNKAIKAHGGEEALMKYKATQIATKGKVTLPGVGDVDFTQEIATMLPDKFKDSMHLTINGQMIDTLTVTNGDNIAVVANGNEVPVNDVIKKALHEVQFLLKAGKLVPLVKDKGYELSLIGESKVQDKPAVGVLVKSKGYNDISLYFDKETGLLAKMERRVTLPMTGKEVTEERIFVRYGDKGKEGIPLPKEVIVKHDGETFLKAEVTEASLLESLDDSTFKK